MTIFKKWMTITCVDLTFRQRFNFQSVVYNCSFCIFITVMEYFNICLARSVFRLV